MSREWASMKRHCWLRLRRHRMRLVERKVRRRLITEIHECEECWWTSIHWTPTGLE